MSLICLQMLWLLELTFVHSNVPSVKRQRTHSQSATPPPELADPGSLEQSEDESITRNGAKKVRNGRNQREQSAKDDKERMRQEAANKRKGRAERRRAEGQRDSLDLSYSIDANILSRFRSIGRAASRSHETACEAKSGALPHNRSPGDTATCAGHASHKP